MYIIYKNKYHFLYDRAIKATFPQGMRDSYFQMSLSCIDFIN